MRAYAMEESPAALIEHNAAMVEDFRQRFFGRKAAKKPTQALIDWENKWRGVQMKGPLTKGSAVYVDTPDRQI